MVVDIMQHTEFKISIKIIAYIDFQDMLKIALRVFTFINQTILRKTKEDTVTKAGVFGIAFANLRHRLKTMLGVRLQLQYPNDTLQFPLPNRWSHPNLKMSKQQPYMVIKQVGLNLKPAGIEQRKKINEDPDRAYSAIHVMGLLNTIRLEQIDMIKKVTEEYNLLSDVVYTKQRELLFADSLVNGQHSYMLRKYANDHYDIPYSKAVDENYRKALQRSLENQTWNDNTNVFGLTKDEIIRRVTQNEGVYAMLFEHLEYVSKGDVIKHKPEIYIDDEPVDQMHYMHVPYPVFLRLDGRDGKTQFICIAVGVRLGGSPRIFSPFFAAQGERVWRLVQSHVCQTILNDFSVRVHLGVYHFTTNQYHVPIYNYLSGLKGTQSTSFLHFLNHTYALFSRGLEGVNVAATASLVHEVPKYSLVNKVFNMSQDNAVAVIAQTSNNLKIFEYDPITILKNNGLQRQEIEKYFDKLSYDIQLYEIISKYIEEVYHSFHIDELQVGLLDEINEQTKFMGVGAGSTPRAPLRNRQDVLRTIINLCFCWVGFHSHTFSTISLATYALFRPSMLKTEIPANSKKWESIQIGQELPDTKIIMETGKLNEATTQRDSDNFLLDNIRRQAETAAYNSKKFARDAGLKQAFGKVEQTATDTLKQLREYEGRLLKLNSERKERSGSVVFEWMVPSKIQTSLNI